MSSRRVVEPASIAGLRRPTKTGSGFVRVIECELADRRSSRPSDRQLTPLGQGGRTVLFEDVAGVEVTVEVEVIVD